MRSSRVSAHGIDLSAPAAVVAIDRGILAVPQGRGDVLVYNANKRDAPPEMLTGIHSSPVTGLCISWRPWPCLYTGAADGIARWALEFVSEDPLVTSLSDGWQEDDELSSELLTGDLERAPAHVAVDAQGDRLAAAINCYTLIISCCSGKVLARLEGHNAPVTSAAFRSDHTDSVITIGEDRRFIVYDIKAATILYGSSIVSSSPFISLAAEDAMGSRCAMGSSDGKVRIYSLATPDCRLLHTIDIPTVTGAQQQPWLMRPPPPGKSEDAVVVISSEPAWKRALQLPAGCLTHEHQELPDPREPDEGFCAFALAFVRPTGDGGVAGEDDAGGDGAGGRLSGAAAVGGMAGIGNTSSNEWQEAARRAPFLLIATPQVPGLLAVLALPEGRRVLLY